MIALFALLASSNASAQEPVDIGVVQQSDVRVVQRLLYPKDGRTEMGLHVGWMPFDALLTTPNLAFSFTKHTSEEFGLGAWGQAGYGIANGRLHELQSPSFGVTAEAYRYLASVGAGVEWSPIYAKMTTNGKRIWHYDVFAIARGGASLGSSIIPGGGIAVAPMAELGVGTRVFTSQNAAVRVGLTDAVLLEHRKLTDSTYLTQHVNVTIGIAALSPAKSKGK